MGLREIYSTIEDKALTILDLSGNTAYKHMHTWNDQVKDLIGKTNKDVSMLFPQFLIEVNVDKIEELGLFHQLWSCTAKFHLIHQKLHSGMEYEQNWDVFELADATWNYFQGWHPMANNMSTFVAVENKQNFSHNNVYEFIQSYKFNYEYINRNNTFINVTGTTISFSGSTISVSY